MLAWLFFGWKKKKKKDETTSRRRASAVLFVAERPIDCSAWSSGRKRFFFSLCSPFSSVSARLLFVYVYVSSLFLSSVSFLFHGLSLSRLDLQDGEEKEPYRSQPER